jgi:modulator of FtsH protease
MGGRGAMLLGVVQWDSFFVATAGAAAALAGLLFVAISINVKEILSYSWLPARAAGTIAMLVAALVESGLALMPGQSIRWLGGELLVVGVALTAVIVPQQVASLSQPSEEFRRQMVSWAVATMLATVPAPVAGIVFLAGSTAGGYVLAASILVSFMVSVLNAWVLLVEILR